MPGTFSPPPISKKTASKRPRHASRHVRHASAVMHVGSLTRCGVENVPGIPGACATRNFTYLARGPWMDLDHYLFRTVNIGPSNGLTPNRRQAIAEQMLTQVTDAYKRHQASILNDLPKVSVERGVRVSNQCPSFLSVFFFGLQSFAYSKLIINIYIYISHILISTVIKRPRNMWSPKWISNQAPSNVL